MTREEAIKRLETNLDANKKLLKSGVTANGEIEKNIAALQVAISALRGPTREQVEKMRGEWIIEDAGDGDRRKKCSLCNQPISGWWGRDRFCANCGSPMTDEAVDMVMERIHSMLEV